MFIIIHGLVIRDVYYDVEELTTEKFWYDCSWVAFLIWFTFCYHYLPEIKTFTFIFDLIENSVLAILEFIIVFLACITAFTDVFNAMSQGKFVAQWFSTSASISDSDLKLRTTFEYWLKGWQGNFIGAFTAGGDWDKDGYFDNDDWIFVFLFCIVLIVLLLNLLISIITMAQGDFTNNQT